ncbi:hypothetical protein NEOLEDRAFT_1238809 [Neolentinus lepideus HHB14362 ss-1]|uniref:Uncharacterized protein n=1 Tax=Neolentinus lepideus HHB14362 ss-1 TaxID=1314782 RepID=A0A165V9H8_9AGAM|nr:hypothetical protein NEOLEDRAFT_1238809 [Neolentinus lepideus HHB14362 ss-1]
MALRQTSTAKKPTATGSISKGTSRTLTVPSVGLSISKAIPSTSSTTSAKTATLRNAKAAPLKISKSFPSSASSSRLGKSDSKTASVSQPPVPKATSPSASSVSSTRRPPPKLPVLKPLDASDTLQVAAQLYSWLYMNNSLKKAQKTSYTAAREAVEQFRQKLRDEESEIADQRIRFETERLICFLEELASDEIAEDVAWAMQTLTRNEGETSRVMSEALHLAGQGLKSVDYVSPMHRPNQLLDDLVRLKSECTDLEATISRVLCKVTRGDSNLGPVLETYLHLLKGRSNNLDTAVELMLSVKENVGMWLEKESLAIDANGR